MRDCFLMSIRSAAVSYEGNTAVAFCSCRKAFSWTPTVAIRFYGEVSVDVRYRRWINMPIESRLSARSDYQLSAYNRATPNELSIRRSAAQRADGQCSSVNCRRKWRNARRESLKPVQRNDQRGVTVISLKRQQLVGQMFYLARRLTRRW